MTFDMAHATALLTPIMNYFIKMWWVLVYEPSIWLMGITVLTGYVLFPIFDIVVGIYLGSIVYSDPFLGASLTHQWSFINKLDIAK